MIRSQWVNIDDEGALPALLRRIADRVPPAGIDALWIYPTRRASGAESTVIALSVFDEHGEKRRVGAVRFLVTRDRRGRATVAEQFAEYARAPADAIHRIIEGTLRRLESEAAAPPRHESIAGDADRWDALLTGLADPAEPHTRRPALLEPEPITDDT